MKAVRLRIYTSEDEKIGHLPLYEAVAEQARTLGLAGLTVFRGIFGFGRDRHIHTVKVLSLSENLPVVLELIDTRERIEALLPFLDTHLRNGIYTLEEVELHIPQ
ncbi:DUF190 domain-containing protein [Spirochaeta thermophila]|uniref:CBS domain containing protein n=1 Tax=Winmispira thermophila (strain ATCC 49972 / DSM 6192 / RI 19.B1) TaxID=665571 RepID=E0RNK7_WINT6|nr:DUF190 domain-containing protein [Spirochaeta thermophila]ADN02598.1 CBS domain containing protein [Spirochaeta thermophila DSM 6192]